MRKLFKTIVTLSISVFVLSGCLTPTAQDTTRDTFTNGVINQIKTGTSLTGKGSVQEGAIPTSQANLIDIQYDVTLNNRSLLFNVDNKLANGQIESTKFISSLDATVDESQNTKYEIATHTAMSQLKSLSAADFEYETIDSNTSKIVATNTVMNQKGSGETFVSYYYSIEIIADSQDFTISSINIIHDEITSESELSQDSLMLLVDAKSKADFEKSTRTVNNSSYDLWQSTYMIHQVELTK